MVCKCGGYYYTLNAKASFDRDLAKTRKFLLRNVSAIRMFTNGFFRSKWRSVAGNRRILSCLEMMDSETPPRYLCSPEGLLKQIQSVSKKRIINLIGRNTTERLDKTGLWKIRSNCYNPQAEVVRSFTYFRMNGNIFKVKNWNNFVTFVRMISRDL